MSSVSQGYGTANIGDINTRFKVTMKNDTNGTITTINLSAVAGVYDTFQMQFLKPNGESVTETAALFTDGTDGVIKYDNTDAAFLDVSGTWRRRGIISHSVNGNKFTGSWVEFEVSA